MPNTIRLKRGTAAPVAGNLVTGEIAINTATGDAYTKTDGGTVIKIGPSAGGGGATTFYSTTVDFGAVPLSMKTFSVTHSGATTSQYVIASVSVPSTQSLDELEMEPLAVFARVSATNTIEFVLSSVSPGGFVSGQRVINYLIG